MPITIQGIRVKQITIGRDDEGADRISASYELVSSADKVLAKENVTSKASYGETVFVPPSDVTKLLSGAVMAYKKALEQHLGLVE